MLNPSDFHSYQLKAINFLIRHPRSMLWLFMGAGKTSIAETAFDHLKTHGAVRAALALGPLRVVQSVWEQEARKWSHLRHLRFSLIHGSPDERMRALTRPADIYLINYEGLPWLSAQLQHYFINRGTLLPFDMLIADEIPKLKNYERKRAQAMIPLLPYFTYRTGLTGTPASNGLEDLFGQYLMIDDGQRLGTDKDIFLANLFERGGYNGYRYEPTPEGEAFIHRAVADITLEMPQDEYLKLPDFIVNDIYVDMAPKHRRQYEQLEMQLFTELDNGAELEVMNEASKSNKLLQFSNGAVYTNTETKEWEPVHTAKLDALEEVVDEAGGEPILVGYNYKPDAYRIMERFPYAKNLSGMSGKEFNQTLEDWGEGRLRMLIGHGMSMGHGVDRLQKRGHILVWFGLPWSLELYLQFNARLHRQGQGHPVICHRILGRNTFDEVPKLALSSKAQTQDTLRRAVDEYRKRKEGRAAA